jgi:glycosyltransferase involved in cell wall biosynthesis
MARGPYALALAAAAMTTDPTTTNAAIWFGTDGYDPAKGLNGRRVAGESFLRGFFTHAKVDEFVSLAHSTRDHQAFAAIAKASGVTRPLRHVRLDAPALMGPVQVVSYPAPPPPHEFWRRAPYGGAAWAYCGITHTTATRAVMQAVFDMRAAPQMPWDALICTSRAVLQSIIRLMELAEEHLATRFPGAVLPARPLLPVVPLGVHAKEFAPDPALGAALRARLGFGPADIAVSCIARLTPDEKFDPFPLFLALEAAAPALAAKGGRFHLILCGVFRDAAWPPIFAEGAQRLMPSVGYTLLDGAVAADRKATLSGSDIFVFPIDNLQETFGLAPIEAMAAGLPVIVSDWDGMKDTVLPEVGFRIPTEMPRAGEATYISLRHLGGTDTYLQYLSQISALTRIDVGALTRALVALGTDAGLRARMGAAGTARARAVYDWSVVIPQMQALWGEQAAMLAHARSRGGPATLPANPARLPTGPAPEVMFEAYPSRPAPDRLTRRLRAVDIGPRPDIAATLALRRYAALGRLIDEPARLELVLSAHAAAGPNGATLAEVAANTGLTPAAVARITLWLTKYHFLEDVP